MTALTAMPAVLFLTSPSQRMPGLLDVRFEHRWDRGCLQVLLRSLEHSYNWLWNGGSRAQYSRG